MENLKNSPRRPEIMSPAGDFVCLSAALQNGADAVYLGLKGSNMRAGARNFEVGDLAEVVKNCREYGAKAYLTLNNIYFDREAPTLDAQISAARDAEIDAIIAWDFSAIERALSAGIEVFLSTQASVANSDAVCAYYKRFGIKRFVLARECALSDIAEIKKAAAERLGEKAAAEIKIEVFAHGAMCVSMSGRCFMSQFYGGKSANRGECLQPCRREYRVSELRENGAEFVVGDGYVLSPRDLCTLPFIEKLFEAGVDSLKIEGRNRNAQYVSTATKAYRTARDFWLDNSEAPDFVAKFGALKTELLKSLSENFNRGFSAGFYMGKPAGDWTSDGNRASVKKLIVGRIKNYLPKIGVAEIVVDDHAVKIGDTLCVEGNTTGYLQFELESAQIDSAAVPEIRKGQTAAIKIPSKVRPNDRIYLLAKI